MPHSINGIGTHYYGRSNSSQVVGRCEHCGRRAQLSSYDTWECICVLFIPLVPIGRYRVLNDCAACRRHQRMKLADFRRVFDEQVVPLRERTHATPNDTQVRHSLVEALMQLQMWTEADREARSGVAALPDDPELNRLAGEIAAYRGERAAATPYLRKAADLAPQSAPQRTRLGQHLLDLGQTEEAIRELTRAQALDSSRWEAAYSLGQALLKLKRYSEALPALERVLALQPDFGGDQALAADVARCKRALNYPLSPEEEKASKRRWWWPFGRPGGAKPERPARGIPAWVILPVLGAAALVAVGFALWKQQHVPVYFVNGLPVRVTLAVGSESHPLAPQELLKRSLPPGPAEVVVSGAKGQIERTKIEIPSLGLFEALESSRFYVYNVSERHIYSRWTVTYTTSSTPGSAAENGPAPQLIALQRFFPVEGVDFAFATPPQSISMSSGVTTTRRTAFDVVRDLDFASLAAIRLSDKQVAEAERAARKAVEIEGCALRARRTLVRVLQVGKHADAALPEIARWRQECPDAGIELERTYQDAMRQAGRREALRQEYTARLAQSPGDAATHYLLGRLEQDPRAGLEQQRQAVRADPELTWAHVAMAYDLLALERPAEAFDALSTALELPHESVVILPFAHAAIASGRLDEAAQKLEAMSRRAPREAALVEARWLIAVARRAWPDAKRLDAQLAELTHDDEETMTRAATVAALAQSERGAGKAPAASAAASQTAAAGEIQFHRLAEQQKHKEAVAALDAAYTRARKPLPPSLQLHAASELLLAGEDELAKKRLQQVETGLRDSPAEPEVVFLRTAASVLGGEASEAQLLEAAHRSGYLDLDDAYYWAGVRAQRDGQSSRARQHWRRSASLCCDFHFPYLAAKRLGAAAERE